MNRCALQRRTQEVEGVQRGGLQGVVLQIEVGERLKGLKVGERLALKLNKGM